MLRRRVFSWASSIPKAADRTPSGKKPQRATPPPRMFEQELGIHFMGDLDAIEQASGLPPTWTEANWALRRAKWPVRGAGVFSACCRNVRMFCMGNTLVFRRTGCADLGLPLTFEEGPGRA